MKNFVFEFEKKRDFGQIIGDSLYFFTKNFKSFLLGFLTYVGPLFLIGALAMVYSSTKLANVINVEMPVLEMLYGVFLSIPIVMVATLMMTAFVCAMVQRHIRGDNAPLAQGIWPDVRRNLWPASAAFLVILAAVIVPYLLLILLGYALGSELGIALVILIFLPVLLYVTVPLSIFLIVHVLERTNVSASLRKAFFLVREKWWLTFGVYIVLSILASIVSYIFVIPAYIGFFISALGSASTGEFGEGFGLWLGIMYACIFLGSLFAGMYQLLGMILHYYSLREQKEGTGLLRRIEELDQTPGGDYV